MKRSEWGKMKDALNTIRCAKALIRFHVKDTQCVDIDDVVYTALDIYAGLNALWLSMQELGDNWLPIETAPKDGQRVLTCKPRAGKFKINIAYFSHGKFVAENNIYWKPTHWMPLPPPPEDKT